MAILLKLPGLTIQMIGTLLTTTDQLLNSVNNNNQINHLKMKKVILLALLVASLSGNSQLYFSGSFGAGTTAKSFAGATNLGVNIQGWFVQAGFHNNFSQKAPCLYRIQGGRSFELSETSSLRLSAGAGSLDRYYHNGKIQEQQGTWVASLEYGKFIAENAEWIVETTQSKQFNFITVGLKYFFTNGKDKTGCPANW